MKQQLTGLGMTLTMFFVAQGGCAEESPRMARGWHQRFGWQARDYFEQPNVIGLCNAIEANDIKEIERLIADGVDVNARGKDNMTPLLWAFPDNKLERFKLLLKHGADPNVAIASDLHTHGAFRAGDSVTHMACRTEFPGYFEAVFAYGGDPNLERKWWVSGITPLFSVIMGSAPDKLGKVKYLVEKGADINHMNGAWATPSMQAVGWGSQFDIALLLLQSGADFTVCKPNSNTRLIHTIVFEERLRSKWTPRQVADYQKIVDWLEKHGESIDTARSDIKRWQSWSNTTGEYQRKMDVEVADRIAKETREKAAATKSDEKGK